jgi:hypothetical protein
MGRENPSRPVLETEVRERWGGRVGEAEGGGRMRRRRSEGGEAATYGTVENLGSLPTSKK